MLPSFLWVQQEKGDMMAKKKAKADAVDLRKVLTTWRSVIAAITTLSETEAYEAIQLENEGAKRKDIMLRLYGRFSRLRAERELKEMLEGE